MITITQAVVAAAGRHPDRPALAVDGETWTYAELIERAGVLADLIRRTDAPDGDLVAVHGERSAWVYAGILGALLAGRGYVPLSPSFPAERSLAMLRRSTAATVVVAGPTAADAGDVLTGADRPLTVIIPEADAAPSWAAGSSHHVLLGRDLPAGDGAPEAPPTDPDAVAYLLFTSGTTGEPKGIGIPHSRVAAYIAAIQERYAIGPDDRCSQNFALTFDLSVHDMFLTWAGGACLCVPSARAVMAPAAFIQEQRLTSWFSTPSTAAIMLRLRMLKPGAFPTLRWSLFCGEALPATVADAWRAAAPNAPLDNLYGPTEATIACTVHRYDGEVGPDGLVNGVVPIGAPFGGTRVAVVDGALRPVADGHPGELLLGGPQLAPGYWRDPDRTTASFVSAPALDPHGPWYRTGDLVARGADNELVYRGRTDDQIKIRGHRVELGEVEEVLRRASGAAAVVALGWPRTPAGADGIVAFLVGPEGGDAEILDECRRLLPDYMIPAHLHRLETMPQNASGKADRRRLIAIHEGPR